MAERECEESKKAQEKVGWDKAKLEAMLESIPEHMSMMDRDLNILWANETARRIFGESIVGRKCYEVYHGRGEPCEPYPCITLRAFEDGKPHEHDTRVIDREGKEISFHCTASVALKDEEGNPVAVIEISRDITQLVAAQQALRESEAKYRHLVAYAPSGIMEVDIPARKFTDVNDVMTKYMGYTREEFLGMDLFDILTERSRALHLERIKRMTAGEKMPENIEYEVKTKDGRELWLLVNSKISFDQEGKPVKATVVAHNITERKWAEKALAESQKKYRQVVENSIEGMLVTQNRKIVFANKAVCDFLGLSPEEVMAFDDPFEFIHPDDRELALENHLKRLRDEDALLRYSIRVVNPKGEVRWVEASGLKIVWEGGPAILNFYSDITERKRAEEERERLQAQLEHIQRMETIGILAGGIAHDFNNLLMAIQGNVSLGLLDTSADSPVHERLENIEEQVRQGSELTKQLLGFSRRRKYEVRPTDLSDVISNQNRMLGRTKKDVKIHEEYSEDLWTADVDRGQIEQVLLNLYVNAWQAMPEGGDLYVEARNTVVNDYDARMHQVEPGRYVEVAVTDTGEGMSEKVRQRIFEPFFTTRERGRGTGLGLATVYGIIKNHGGFVTVESKKGKGSTFRVYLPASSHAVPEAQPGGEDVVKGSETVLLVEDETAVLDVNKKMLQRLGYHVLAAENGEKALELYRDKKDEIDIVVLDLVMPGMDGNAVFKRIREINPHEKILVASGYGIEGYETGFTEAEYSGSLQKPFSIKALSRKMRAILGERRD
ncbi:MAG: PAS domain S-box protein [Deltaproteobacteria bacterium]|nr:PAS domain S-box protein [Deltaproteobacteria bacterium]